MHILHTDLHTIDVQVGRRQHPEAAGMGQQDRRSQEDLAHVTGNNTKLLEKVAQLTKTQYDIEDQLNTTTQHVKVADSGPADKSGKPEREMVNRLPLFLLLRVYFH